MATKRLDELTASTTVAATDLVLKESAPTGAKTHEKITIVNFIKGLFNLNQWVKQASVANPDAGYMRVFADATGFLNAQDESGNIRKIQPIKYIPISIFGPTETVASGDGKAYFVVPPDIAGYNVVSAYAYNVTAGTTATQTVDLYNYTDSVDIFSSALTTADGVKLGTTVTIDGTKDDLAAYDVLRVDVTTTHTTPGTGLIVVIGVQYP
jgi:hypothetical protein